MSQSPKYVARKHRKYEREFPVSRLVKEVMRMDPKLPPTDPAFFAAVILMSSWVVGPNMERIRRHTGYKRDVVREVCRNFREGGLWRGNRILHSDSYANPETNGVQFWIDVNIGLGYVSVAQEKP